MNTINIEQVKEKADLLKIANNHRHCLIPELSKELKVSKTAMVDFILSNPKLFHTENIWSYRDKKVRRRLFPGSSQTYNDIEQVKSRNLGLGVLTVYLKPEDNFRTEEWLNRQIETQQRYLFVDEYDNYGQIDGYFLPYDTDPHNQFRFFAWRNTSQKVDSIKERFNLKPAGYWVGGFGDSYFAKPHGVEISLAQINELKKEGYTFNEFKPLARWAAQSQKGAADELF